MLNRIFLSFSFFLVSVYSFAQTDLASPYTIFGAGIAHHRQTVAQAGMGGTGLALSDPYRMNIANPAALAFQIEPVFESSGKGTLSTFSTSNSSFENRNFILNNLGISVPLKRGKWGLALGIVPYTTVGYDVVSEAADPNFLSTGIAEYSGDGGLNQSYISMGYKLFDRVDSVGNVTNFALGGTFNFNFGTIDNNRDVTFPGDPASRSFRYRESILLRDVSFDIGAQYHTNIIKRTEKNLRYMKLLLGATYSMGANQSAEKTALAYNYSRSILLPDDTIFVENAQKGFIRIPTKVGLGMGLDYVSSKRTRIRFALDYTTQEWSDYAQEFGDEANTFQFQNSQRLSAGIEYTPTLESSDYIKTIEYRAGFHYEKSNLNLRNTDITDVGMSFGLTLPLHHRRGLTKSAFHVAGEYGNYGTTDNELIKEEYYRIFVGFSFTPHFRNRWFVQPKYD